MAIRLVGIITGFLAVAYGLQTRPLPVSELAKKVRSPLESRALSRNPLEDIYPEYKIATPINHFPFDSIYEPHVDGTFGLRYWFDAQFYQPGGPVIVLCAGETSGVDRLPFLQKGIVHELANATGGIAVILEHRYYGDSIPVGSFSTKDLRFLTTEQALADTVHFAKNVKFAGLEDVDLHPSLTLWIAYGGSYAGAFAAFLRATYIDVFFGSISSSGVPTAIWDYWDYYEAVRLYGPPDCIETTQKVIDIVDRILMDNAEPRYISLLKESFGLGNLTHDDDFANTISHGIATFQNLNWDPAISDETFYDYCDHIVLDEVPYPYMEERRESVMELLVVAGYQEQMDIMLNRTMNYIGWLDNATVSKCDLEHRTHDECFTLHNSTFYRQDDLSQTWRLWLYQVCTEWGYLQTGSGVPKDQMPLISRTIDLQYTTIVCREAFNRTKPADLNRINKYGAYDIRYPRLAFIDGEWDPWRRAGVHAPFIHKRKSTTQEPFILIPHAVHHWDENGLFPNETSPGLPPSTILNVKEDTVTFVREWLKDWSTDDRTSTNNLYPAQPARATLNADADLLVFYASSAYRGATRARVVAVQIGAAMFSAILEL